LGSGGCSSLAAIKLERTIKLFIPESELLMASGKLLARKSVCSSLFNARNGRTMTRETVLVREATAVLPESDMDPNAPSIARAEEYRSSTRFAIARRITRSNISISRDPLSGGGI
jgi:hypothetical protein